MSLLSWGDIETNAIAFAKRWRDCSGNERQEAQSFEKDFMSVFGVDWLEGQHEYKVYDVEGRLRYIDYLLPKKIIIEMKSKGESLTVAYNQAYEYTKCLKPDEYPELLLVSDFEYIEVTNLKTMKRFKKFKLNQLKKYIRMFGTLAGYTSDVDFKTDIEVNVDASYKMAKLHDALKDSGYTGEDLEQYLVRLLFCMFAEDTGIFEEKSFENYIINSKEDGSDLSSRIAMLFEVLNTDEKNRMSTLPIDLKAFRYINGRLFDKILPMAYFNHKMRKTLIECCDFDWSYISPAIFGAMFQGVMDDKRRREMGAHYTDEDNIMKVIKPLFLDDLWEEFEKSKATKFEIEAFHKKLSSLTFLDPACGCGNFLIITYRELRLLEFEVLKMLYDNRQIAIIDTFCEVSIEQFYGIEYEEFPSQIARVAMILMKHQMDKLVSNYFGKNIIDFPIKETANIVYGNALKIDWEEVVQKNDLDYILGNPPFVGARYMNKDQAKDLKDVFDSNHKVGTLDYVCAWYYKASKMMDSSSVATAFVSTNSIVQGEQVSVLWKILLEEKNMKIDFAYQTFIWSNEAKGKASVHCVIIGLSSKKRSFNSSRKIFKKDDTVNMHANINGYLLGMDDVFVKPISSPLSNVPKIKTGTRVGAQQYVFKEHDMLSFIEKEPLSKNYFHEYLGGEEFLNGKKRYCLYLEECSISDLSNMPKSREIIESVKEERNKKDNKLKDYPRKYTKLSIPSSDYIFIPQVSSSTRRYIPMDFISKNIWPADPHFMIENATLFLFGVLMSNIHMAWMRTVAGRLKTDYRYSSKLVYNTFIFPNLDNKDEIEHTAQKILDVRKVYNNESLSNIYNPIYMPSDLRKAHIENDKAVWKAYGKSWDIKSEEDCITYLMKLYKSKVESL